MSSNEILTALAISAMGAALQSWRALANAGLLSPQELDTMVHGLNVPFETMEDPAVGQRMQAMLEAHFGAALAEVHQAARANWKGRGTSG